MTGVVWWLVERASALLDAEERDAVRGDLAELNVAAGRALREVVGLLVRRQLRLWTDWRPWLALAGLVIPLGMLLSLISRQWANTNSIYAWLYVDNWTWSYIETAGARHDLVQICGTFLLECVTLVCWACTLGFTLGSLSRRTIWVTGTLFGAVLFGGTLGSSTAGLRNPGNAAVFSLMIYRDGFPTLVRTVLVLVPAVIGMRKGVRQATLPLPWALISAVAVVTLTALAAPSVKVSVTWGWWSTSGEGPAIRQLAQLRDSWQLRLLPMLMVWPVAYMVASATRRHWRRQSATA